MTDAPWSTARVQVWHNKWLVGIIRVYAPIAVDAYVLDADDLAVFRKRAPRQQPKTRAFSQYVYRAGSCRAHRCGRALPCQEYQATLAQSSMIAKTARNLTAPTISRKSGRVRGQQVQETMSHGLCPDVMLRNAGPACQEYQTTLAQSSMIGGKRLETSQKRRYYASPAERKGAE